MVRSVAAACSAGLGNVDLYTATRHYFGGMPAKVEYPERTQLVWAEPARHLAAGSDA